MKELTTQTGIIVKCSKTAIEFFQNAQSVDFFSALEIPKEFQDIAVEFYDLILENDHPTALLGCRGNYDIAVQIDEVTGTMTGWHWFKMCIRDRGVLLIVVSIWGFVLKLK